MGFLIWFLIAAGAVVLETIVADLSMLMIAGGALAAAGVGLADVPLWVEVAVFAATTVVLFLAARPALRRRLQSAEPSDELESNARTLPGKTAVVLEEVTATGGMVRIAGDVWSARAIADNETYEAQMPVTVVSVDGNTLIVSQKI